MARRVLGLIQGLVRTSRALGLAVSLAGVMVSQVVAAGKCLVARLRAMFWRIYRSAGAKVHRWWVGPFVPCAYIA